MFELGVRTTFAAQHFLVGGDFGKEGEKHSHDYRVEVVVRGPRLNEQGFLVDIVKVKQTLGELADRYRDECLNDFPELEGKNPGCEEFARVFARRMASRLPTSGLALMTVKIWEDDEAWASYEIALRGSD